MGTHDQVTSIQLICCNSKEWYHKRCLKEQAFRLEDEFKCPNCSDVDTFRENMLQNGVFIPKSDSVAQYRSFNGEDAVEINPPQKKKRIRKDWIHEATFLSKKEADKFLADEGWGYFFENKSDDGVTITYRCKHVKFRGVQCEAGVRLFFDARSSRIQLHRADCDHTHENHPNARDDISDEVKNEITRLFEVNVTKPNAIKRNLAKKNFEVPIPSKLNTFLKKLNDDRKGKEKINCGTLEKWLQENTPMPNDETTPFVLNYEMDYEDEKNIDLRFIVTTKLLLKQAIGCDLIHADATYKLTWQGFPVLVVGITDRCRSFHPVGIAVCSSEKQKDFEFIFAAVQQGIHNIFETDFEPKYVIADAAFAIHNAAIKVFGPDVHTIMCWFHMRRAVSDKLPTFIKDLSKQRQFLMDLDCLQVAKSAEIFKTALKLFIEKWRAESEDMIKYFESEWVNKHPNWFEAFAKLIPSTNNALESHNRIIKDEHTIRELMDLGAFRFALFEMVKDWANKYPSGRKKERSNAPEIDLPLWTGGYRFAKANAKIKTRRRGNKIVYRSFTSDSVDESTDWVNFNDFKVNSFGFYDTTFVYPTNRDNWLKSECDCSDFYKLYMCAHIIGIAIRLKCIQPPAEAKTVPIGQKRKPGRPAKAKPALVRQ